MSAHAAIRVTVVGCSGSYPGPDSPASCYLLEADDADGRTWRVLLDLGNGALGQLHNVVDPLLVDAVLLSHLHADHCLDLCGYYVMRKYHPDGPPPRIPVWGPTDTARRLAAAYDLPLDPGMTEEFDFRPYPDGAAGEAVQVGPFTVRALPADHPVEAYALRVEAGGAVLAYSGDTAPCEGLEEAARGADVLLAEASFRAQDDNPPHIHLTGTDCGETAARAAVRHLVLTHIPPWFDKRAALEEARTRFDGEVSLAVSGGRFEV